MHSSQGRASVSIAALLALVVGLLVPSAGRSHAPGQNLRVIVRANAATTNAAEREVVSLGGRVVTDLPLVGGFAAVLPSGTERALARHPAVARVWRDPSVAMASASDCPVGSPTCFDALPPDTAWEDAIGLPRVPHRYSGSGVTVALLDTGVTPSADLGARLLARVDLTSEHDGIDHFGHGTHLSGLIAGDGTLSQERYEGSASEASLVSIKVAGWDGATDVSTVIAGIQWAVSNRDSYGIRVLNLSFGTDAIQSAAVDPLDYAVEQAWRAGIVVVVAAGNRGGPGNTISKPGDDPLVITVGSADVNGTPTPVDDTVASFSSRGPTQDAFAKPDVLAPGVSLVSIRAPGSTADAFRSIARVGDTYFKGTGTSQSAAIVSGVVARMLDANPALTPDEVKGVLMQTAHGELAGSAGGAGLVDAEAAVASVVPAKKGPQAALPLANRGLPLSDGTGSLEGSRGTQHVVADGDGDGIAEPLVGELDALGAPWSPSAFTVTPWTPTTWGASPWSLVVAVLIGSTPAPTWGGSQALLLAWEAKYWGATTWTDAGWDAKYWGAKYWGAKYWGTGLWQ